MIEWNSEKLRNVMNIVVWGPGVQELCCTPELNYETKYWRIKIWYSFIWGDWKSKEEEKNKWRLTEKNWFSISNIRYWKYETYMKYGTDRFIGDGVQSGLNHPKNIERKTITGRVAGKTAKLNS